MSTESTQTRGAAPAAVTPITRKRTSRASRGAAKSAAANGTKSAAKKPAAKPAPKPTPAKTELTANAKRLIVMNAMVAASAEVIRTWDAKATGVTKEEARAFMANRLSYAGPKVDWPEKILGPREKASGK